MSRVVRWLLQRPGSAELAPLAKLLPQAGAHEQRLRGLADGELAAAARAARDDAEVCACGREAARRALGERPYDVQLLGALAMLSGLVAEMATGEGKTLSGALAAAGYALRGRPVHVMSVNDYLARRDAEWMRPVYDLLGVTVGWIGQGSTEAERRRAYAAQVTYAPVSEFGFDVLRDRLVTDAAGLVAGDPDVVLIDEADSVLIDEARVPLVLAGAAESADADREMARIAAELVPGDHYEVDEDARNVSLTSAGARAAEQALDGIDLYTAEHAEALTRLNVALHAHALLQRDVDYIVRDGAVHLINESRGRVALRQRWPDGLHGAVEAKEGLAASDSGEILDSITVRSLVRRYRTICGMTGTAVAAGEQLREFYDLEIAVIPPNRPCVRADEPDRLYPTTGEKEEAVVGQVADAHATGRPVLIGTLDVAESERLAARLDRAGLPCTVLNAKNDAQEAAIIAEAGARGAITVSTQMAGRGTDIRLGGTGGDRDLIAELGGLYVIGTGRHASSRLDQQLRGRAGRQGDPGGSAFFASMEDELVLQYAPGEARAGLPDARAHWVLGHAQRVAEGVNLEIHRNTWQYHKLIEDQRRIVLHQRAQALRDDEALAALARRCPERLAELSPGIDRAILASAARQIVLFHLDRAWAEHLAFLADLREGIHLRALARGTVPLNEFNKEAIRAFNDLIEEAAARSAQTFRTAVITADGVDLEASGLKRPTATWTYLVHENPFGTDIDRALRGVARRIRKAGALGRDRSYRWMSYPREELAMCSGDRLVADFEAGAGTAPAVPEELREHLTVTVDGLWVVWAYKLAAQRGGLFVPLRGDSGYPADARAECRARGARGGHRAPDPGCRCGFHALSDRSLPGLPVRGGFSALTVALSGRVLAYEWAGPGVLWRAERQTVVRVGRLALPGWPQEVPGARRRPDDPEGRMAVRSGAAPRDSGPVRLALPADCPVTVLRHDDAGWCTQPGTSRRRTSSLALV